LQCLARKRQKNQDTRAQIDALTQSSTLASPSAQELVDLAWACAVLEIRNELLLRMIATAAASLDVPGMKDLAATAWAFAKVVFKDRSFVDEVQARAGVIDKEASAKDISNIAWACAKLV